MKDKSAIKKRSENYNGKKETVSVLPVELN